MKPLSHKARLSSFIILILLFILLVPILLAYSAGYRFGDALSIVRTGGVYIHSDLSNTKVYINDEFIEDNGVFLRNTLIQNLRPNKKYSVRVEKEGYRTWIKELFVRPNLVSEARILMLKNEIEFRKIDKVLTPVVTASSTKDSVDEVEILNPEYENLSELFLEDKGQFEVDVATTTTILVKGVKTATTTIISEIQLPDFFDELGVENIEDKEMLRERQKMVSWLENGDVKNIWSGNIESIPYFYCIEECVDLITVNLGDDIKRYDYFPGRDDVLVVLTNQGVFAVEIDSRSAQNIQPILEKRDLDFRIENGNTIVIKDGDVFLEAVL